MSLITLRTYNNPIDAHLVKTKLESEGILCILFDENTVGINPLYNILVGGIKLKIHEEDLEKSELILLNMFYPSKKCEVDVIIICPFCGSNHIDNIHEGKSLEKIVEFIRNQIIKIFPVELKFKYKCINCQKKFIQ